MPKDPRLYLIHIQGCCERILEFTTGLEDSWPDVPLVHDAVCRNLEIIGDAARRLDDEFREAHSGIPWRAMTDVRNILIHAYDRVAPEILAGIVRQDIPPSLPSIIGLLGNGF